MSPALLDTDILSELFKLRNVAVRQKSLDYSRLHGQLAISMMTQYEVVRGYKDQQATTQLARFRNFCANSLVLPVSESILERAADLWVLAGRGGFSRNDADLIIAATALEHGRILVTGNLSHFNWIPVLTLEDWRQP